MQATSNEIHAQWTAEKIVPILRQMQQDGRWDKLPKWLFPDIEEFIQRIEGFSQNYPH